MYELIYFVSSKTDEKNRFVLMDQIEGFITQAGGKIVNRQDEGEKALAYEIKKETTGYNVVVYFDLESEEIKKLDENLKKIKELLRFQIFKTRGVAFEKKEKIEPEIVIESRKDESKKDFLEI